MRKSAVLAFFGLLGITSAAQTGSVAAIFPGQNARAIQVRNARNAQAAAASAGLAPEQAGGSEQQTGPGSMAASGSYDPNSAQPPAGSYPQEISPAPTGSGQIPVNTEMHAALDTPLSSKTSRPGDRFTATVADPVRGTNGAVIVPAGSRVEGEVTDAEQSEAVPALHGKPQLSLRFRDIVLPGGQTVGVTATLVSVNSTTSKSNRKAGEGQIQSGTEGKGAEMGAGAGSVPDLIFGSPLKGLAIGTLAGGGYVLATKGKGVELPAQTGLVIRFDQPLTLSGMASPQPMQR